MDLAFNRLVELPPAFGGLASLRHLDLSYNLVSEVVICNLRARTITPYNP